MINACRMWALDDSLKHKYVPTWDTIILMGLPGWDPTPGKGGEPNQGVPWLRCQWTEGEPGTVSGVITAGGIHKVT